MNTRKRGLESLTTPLFLSVMVLAFSALVFVIGADGHIPRACFLVAFAGLAGWNERVIFTSHRQGQLRAHLAPAALLLMAARYAIPSDTIGSGVMIAGSVLLVGSVVLDWLSRGTIGTQGGPGD